MPRTLSICVCMLLLGAIGGFAANSSIDPINRYAWSENIGWLDFYADGMHGVIVTETAVSGFVWCENIGWLNLGYGTNSDPNAFGVIRNGEANLSGFAWSENIGWVNFNVSAPNTPYIDESGQFSGFAWSENAGWIALNSGHGVITENPAEGEGGAEGEGSTDGEGNAEGEGQGTADGEGAAEGEGSGEEEGEGGQTTICHTADQDCNEVISLTELLRVIQFFNWRGYHCVTAPNVSEDGYLPGPGIDHACIPHLSDYNPQDWNISLTELLRLIQFFNFRAYHACPANGTEDGFCPGSL